VYNLFCDMVHPNIGSTFCIMVSREQGISFPVDQTESTGMHLFDRSYPPLQSISGKEFSETIAGFILCKWPESEK
jgi:hypothetical protein